MDFVISTLNLPMLPSFRGARAAVMRDVPVGEQTCLIQKPPRTTAFLRHQDSLLCFKLPVQLNGKYEDDDDTASTSSDCTETSSSSNSCSMMLGASVSFADPVVTNVYSRPTTTREEKKTLFYSEFECRVFRRDYHLCRRRDQGSRSTRDPVVSFCESVVSSVHTYACPAENDDIYYSEADLKRFLDDFVSSLDECTVCET